MYIEMAWKVETRVDIHHIDVTVASDEKPAALAT